MSTITINKTTRAPKGLALKREGGKVALSWKIGDKNYTDGQDFQYTVISSQKKFDSAESFLKQGFNVSGLSWTNVNVGNKTTSKAVSLHLGDYYPNKYTSGAKSGKFKPYLAGIIFRIRGNRQEESTTKKGNTIKTKFSTSDWSYYYYDTKPPAEPTFTLSLTDQSNKVVYSWEAAEEDDKRIHGDIEFETIAKENATSDYNNDDYWKDATTSTEGKSGSYTGGGPNGEDFDISNTSWTRLVRIRARGAGGNSNWVVLYHVFSLPYTARDIKAEATMDEATNSFICNVEWLAPTNFAHPIDNTLVEYAMATPETGMQCPADASWQTGDTRSDTSGTDRSTFSVDGLLSVDTCLFIRIVTEHDSTTNDSYKARSIPIIASRDGTGALKSPQINSVSSYVDSGKHKVQISATNKSDVDDSVLIVSYKNNVDQEPIDIGVITNDAQPVVLFVPDWTNKEPKDFGVRAVVGDVVSKTREGDSVTVVAVKNQVMSSAGIVWDNGTVPKAPENVSAVQEDTDILVTWDWAWAEADSAEVSWADRENAWDSTDEPDTYIVSKVKSSKLYISGLSTGQRYYVRVRLIKGFDENAVYGEYSDVEYVDLNAAPVVPELTLSAGTVTKEGSFVASWSYVTEDESEQDYAVLAEYAEEGGEPVYSELPMKAYEAQRMTLNVKKLGWQTDTEHALCVMVYSKSGRPSKWSTPKYIRVAEALQCNITSTSLITKEFPVNPETHTGDPATFEGNVDDLLKDITSLEVALTPQQDLHGYDKPWSGGNGRNLLNMTSTSAADSQRYSFSGSEGNVTLTSTGTYSRVCYAVTGLTVNSTYTFSAKIAKTATSGSSSQIWFSTGSYWSNSLSGITIGTAVSSETQYTKTFTATDSTVYIGFYMTVGNTQGDVLTVKNAQVEAGSSVNTWEPYSNICPITGASDVDVNVADDYDDPQTLNTYTTSLGTTVYGGSVDVVAGTGTVTYGSVDLGSLNWTYSASGLFYPNSNLPMKAPTSAAERKTGIICSIYAPSTVVALDGSQDDKSILRYEQRVYIKDSAYTDAATFKTAMSGVQLVYELATPTTLTLTPTAVNLIEGTNYVFSPQGEITVDLAEAYAEELALDRMPLRVDIADAIGTVNIVLRRIEPYVNRKPDDDDLRGYTGEAVARIDGVGSGVYEIPLERLSGRLDDGARYQIEASTQDNLGQKAEAEPVQFRVSWADQAVMPYAAAEIDGDIAMIHAYSPTGATEGAYYDIYRLSVDKPELIYHKAQFGETYVDPYPAMGEFSGYRVVYYTANGDYITEDNTYAWEDYETEFESDESIINFNGDQLRLKYNVDNDNTWAKDFQQTKYLGGSVQGDWKAGVLRSGSVGAVLITVTESDKYPKIRRLAEWLGHCHVRTPDGSSYTADIQVSESSPHDKYGLVKSINLTINRIDSVELDGMTLEEWEKYNAVE